MTTEPGSPKSIAAGSEIRFCLSELAKTDRKLVRLVKKIYAQIDRERPERDEDYARIDAQYDPEFFFHITQTHNAIVALQEEMDEINDRKVQDQLCDLIERTIECPWPKLFAEQPDDARDFYRILLKSLERSEREWARISRSHDQSNGGVMVQKSGPVCPRRAANIRALPGVDTQ